MTDVSKLSSKSPSKLAPARFARADAIAAAALFLIAAAVFFISIFHPLLDWDDQFHLTQNPFLQPNSPARYLHFWSQPYGNLFIPITYNVWAFLYAHSVSGGTLSPVWFHAINVVAHAICTVGVYLLLAKWLAGRDASDRFPGDAEPTFWRSHRFAAAVGALLFALHPIQVEAVAWVSELRGLLAAIFSVAALWVYAEESTSLRRSMETSLLASTLLLLALLSKPSAAALPAMMLAADLFLSRRAWKEVALRLIVPAAIAAGCLLLMRRMQTTGYQQNVALWQRPFLAGDTLAFYFAKIVWPWSLCTDYGHTPRAARASAWFWWAWTVPAALLALAAWRRDRMALAGLALFVAALLPVLGLVPFDFQRISTVADRYVYLAMLGPALFVATLVRSALRVEQFGRSMNVAVPAVAGIFAAALGWRSILQQTSWAGDEQLWTKVVEVNPGSLLGAVNLAGIAQVRHDRPEAERLMRRAIEVAPDRGNGYRGLAKLALDSGNTAAALEWYRKGSDADPTDGRSFDGAGKLLAAQGRLDEAEADFRKAVELAPDLVDGWCDLGALYLLRRRPSDALEALAHARTWNPRHPQTLANIAFAYDLAGDRSAADRAVADLDAVAGRSATPRTLLAVRAASREDWPVAEHWSRAATEIDPHNVDAWADLAQTLGKQKKYAEAIATYERGLAANPSAPRLRRELDAAKSSASGRGSG